MDWYAHLHRGHEARGYWLIAIWNSGDPRRSLLFAEAHFMDRRTRMISSRRWYQRRAKDDSSLRQRATNFINDLAWRSELTVAAPMVTELPSPVILDHRADGGLEQVQGGVIAINSEFLLAPELIDHVRDRTQFEDLQRFLIWVRDHDDGIKVEEIETDEPIASST